MQRAKSRTVTPSAVHRTAWSLRRNIRPAAPKAGMNTRRLSSGNAIATLPPHHGEYGGGRDHTCDHRQHVMGHDAGLEPPQHPGAVQDHTGDAIHDAVHTVEID